MGIRAADKFINSILDTVNLLALNPNMGQPIELNTETCKRNYRSFVEHKNHKIIYYVEKRQSVLPTFGLTVRIRRF